MLLQLLARRCSHTGMKMAWLAQEFWLHVGEALGHSTVILHLEEAGESAKICCWLWLHFPSLLIHCSYLKNFLICFLKSWRESRHLHFLIKYSPCYEKENPSGLASSGQTQHVVTYCYQIHNRNRLSGFNPRYLFPIAVQYCLFLIWWLLWPHRLLFCAFPKPEKTNKPIFPLCFKWKLLCSFT